MAAQEALVSALVSSPEASLESSPVASQATEASPVVVPVSLYVGDLSDDVSDGQIFNHFSEFKSLTSVRVCRDSSTGRSLAYAYVNFLSLPDAIRAIEVKNHSILNGKMIRVMWSHRDPDARKSGLGNLFVKNLGDTIDNVQLNELFKIFGNILSAKVVTADDGKSKGFGFVQFETEESANTAIDKLNGSYINGKQIYVAKFVKKSDRVLSSPDSQFTNIYVKNIDLDITEEVLREKFSKFGTILSLVITKDDNGVSKGFGFVNFESPEDARRATEVINGSQLGSKVLYVARAQKKSEREQILRRQFEEKKREQMLKYEGSNVYIKNINDDVTEDELREHFSLCGTITSAKIMRDGKGNSKGFGFVCFSTPEEGKKAVTTFHGSLFHRKLLYVAIAQRKEDRQAQLQMYHMQRVTSILGSPAVIPGTYAPLFYPGPPGVYPQLASHPGIMYQPLGLMPEWRPNGFAPPSWPGFQPTHLHAGTNGPRQHRQHGGRMNGQMHPQSEVSSDSYVPNGKQNFHTMTSAIGSSNQQESSQARYVQDLNIGSSGFSPAADPQTRDEESELLSSRLAAAAPEHQKQILGEQLYPLVQKHQPDLVAKITGMLLEMDNSELLLLLESPEALVAKVDEAVKVLKLSKTSVSGQESFHPSFLSTEVAVN